MIYIGTSGFSYDDWVGEYYPPHLAKRNWLSFYAEEFDACEINSTYYAIPKPQVLERMAAKTRSGFLFTVKANQQMTHVREDNEKVFEQFAESIAPLRGAGRLACILAQFPFSFHPGKDSRDYLEVFRERIGDVPVVVEFRDARWLVPEIFQWLRGHNLGFCCVDEPSLPNLVPPIVKATSEIGYIRFHGRNAAKWWQHEHAYERYDYTYSEEELKEWLPRIRKLAETTSKTFILANNHWRGQAIQTARQLRMMLD